MNPLAHSLFPSPRLILLDAEREMKRCAPGQTSHRDPAIFANIRRKHFCFGQVVTWPENLFSPNQDSRASQLVDLVIGQS